jgi:hypothetical protein
MRGKELHLMDFSGRAAREKHKSMSKERFRVKTPKGVPFSAARIRPGGGPLRQDPGHGGSRCEERTVKRSRSAALKRGILFRKIGW